MIRGGKGGAKIKKVVTGATFLWLVLAALATGEIKAFT